MITLIIKNKKDAEKVHRALIGTPEYVNSKIVISEITDGSGRYELIFGDENNSNITAMLGEIL
jgi:hypothetical protein